MVAATQESIDNKAHSRQYFVTWTSYKGQNICRINRMLQWEFISQYVQWQKSQIDLLITWHTAPVLFLHGSPTMNNTFIELKRTMYPESICLYNDRNYAQFYCKLITNLSLTQWLNVSKVNGNLHSGSRPCYSTVQELCIQFTYSFVVFFSSWFYQNPWGSTSLV